MWKRREKNNEEKQHRKMKHSGAHTKQFYVLILRVKFEIWDQVEFLLDCFAHLITVMCLFHLDDVVSVRCVLFCLFLFFFDFFPLHSLSQSSKILATTLLYLVVLLFFSLSLSLSLMSTALFRRSRFCHTRSFYLLPHIFVFLILASFFYYT